MSETNNAGAAGAGQTGGEVDKLFAEKFKTPEALEAGVREIRKKLELETPDGPLFGKEGKLAPDVLALERQYKDHEKMLGKLGAAKPKTETETKPGAEGLKIETAKTETTSETQTAVDQDLDGFVKGLGLETKALGETWLKDGKLTEEQYAKFQAKGLSKQVVDTHMRGQMAIAQQTQTVIVNAKAEGMKIAGGEAQLQTLLTWAGNKENIPEAELARLNAQIEADPSNYPLVVELLSARHARAVGAGKAKPLMTGSGNSGGSSGAATSKQEFIKLVRAASKGDEAALARVNATPEAQVAKWGP